jgi:hypothetical protein
MNAETQSDGRLRHYIWAVLLLLGMAVGGVVTLNCNPTASYPNGQLEEGQEGVKRLPEGGIGFDVTDTNKTSATFVLPSKVTVGSKDYDVTWKSTDSDDAKVEGDVLATVYKDESRGRHTVEFVGTYLVNGEKRIVHYPLNVANY